MIWFCVIVRPASGRWRGIHQPLSEAIPLRTQSPCCEEFDSSIATNKCRVLHPTENYLLELRMNESNFSSLAFVPLWLETDVVAEPGPNYRFISKINVLSWRLLEWLITLWRVAGPTFGATCAWHHVPATKQLKQHMAVLRGVLDCLPLCSPSWRPHFRDSGLPSDCKLLRPNLHTRRPFAISNKVCFN